MKWDEAFINRKATPPLCKEIFARAEKPLISPNPNHAWESRQTFNAAAIELKGKIHLLYRAVGGDWVSRFGYANSEDGLHISERSPKPVYEHFTGDVSYYSYASGGSFGGAEDPRITRVGNEDRLYMTYTAVDNGLRVALTSIKIKDFLNKRWKWAKPFIISPAGEVHKNWVIFPEKINGKYAILHSISPRISIDYVDSLDEPFLIHSYYDGKSNKGWESRVRGAGAPPIKTSKGWLLLYHAIRRNDPDQYKMGAMLLDLNDPSKEICRSKGPVLEPKTPYETSGFKPGIVYTSGAVLRGKELLVYYGASDNHVCLARANIDDLMKELISINSVEGNVNVSEEM